MACSSASVAKCRPRVDLAFIEWENDSICALSLGPLVQAVCRTPRAARNVRHAGADGKEVYVASSKRSLSERDYRLAERERIIEMLDRDPR